MIFDNSGRGTAKLPSSRVIDDRDYPSKPDHQTAHNTIKNDKQGIASTYYDTLL